MNFFSRRSFLFSVFAAPFAFVSAFSAWAAEEKTVVTTAEEAAKKMANPTDAMPKAIHYNEKAVDAKERKDPKAICANCMQYTRAVTADKKDVKVKGSAVGACGLLSGGMVTSGGWCLSWYAKPA